MLGVIIQTSHSMIALISSLSLKSQRKNKNITYRLYIYIATMRRSMPTTASMARLLEFEWYKQQEDIDSTPKEVTRMKDIYIYISLYFSC
jgi:hypothetical protein